MESTSCKMGNSVGIIFPKNIAPQEGLKFSVYKIGDSFIFKPKKENIFIDDKDWLGFRETLTSEDDEWENM